MPASPTDVTTRDLGRAVAGRYGLLREIGRGAMGAVYEAIRFSDGTHVAVKLIHAHLAKSDINAARFAREARVSQALDHPGIVRTFDAGTDSDGALYLAMELLEGETLREGLDAGHYTNAQAVWIVTEVLRALAVAHRAGVVHRDLKPDNVFIARTADGSDVVKLLDFGIARELESASVTRTETTVGTPHYMAPEQATSAKTVGPAADVWAMGVLLYRLLTGQLPFMGENPYDVMLRVCASPHTPIHLVAPDADPVVAAIAEQCLMKDPKVRPADAAALLRLLDPLVTRPRGLSRVKGHRCPLTDAPTRSEILLAPIRVATPEARPVPPAPTLQVPGRGATRGLHRPAPAPDASEEPTIRPEDGLLAEATLPVLAERTLPPAPLSFVERAPPRPVTPPASVDAAASPVRRRAVRELVLGATLTAAGLLAGAWLWAS